jgi:hypothetical protein
VILLVYGCPVQAIVAALDLDEHTVLAGSTKAGGSAGGFMSTSSRPEGAFLLLCTDELSSYPKQALSVLHERFAAANRGIPGSFCSRVSWSPKRSSATSGDW